LLQTKSIFGTVPVTWGSFSLWCRQGKALCERVGVARGAKGAMTTKIFRKYSHFVLWEAFFQAK